MILADRFTRRLLSLQRFNTAPESPARGCFPLNATLQKQCTGHQATACCDHADARIRYLPLAALTAQLPGAFDDVADRVQTSA